MKRSGFVAVPVIVVALLISAVVGVGVYQVRKQTTQVEEDTGAGIPLQSYQRVTIQQGQEEGAEKAAAGFGLTPQRVVPSPSTIPSPVIIQVTPSPVILTPTPSPVVVQPTPVASTQITSVSPTSVIFGQQFTVTGQNLGNSAGSIGFFSTSNPNVNSGGAVIRSWTSTQVMATVPFVKSGNYFIEVKAASGVTTNRLSLTVAAGQPQITSVAPLSAAAGGALQISGEEFGSQTGHIPIYEIGKSSPIAGGEVSSWTNTSITVTIPATLTRGKEYFIQVSTADNRQSSVKTFKLQ